ncbi:hypothetical protein A5756_19860 [Mycobacterium sp. 852002-53434_SCH5985345]|nr:hypothetical protein A5756_19860 [Mycobacterium sp. 852002-53434_SCH5985345]OBF71527.1 hypothetical protein A5750_20425 [Mycobacterium sp. 852002-51613_SCH5001154]OBF89944.1 hypothetical protein A5773_02690 [Mycobacterium sp. 852014-52450_SCH5900713]
MSASWNVRPGAVASTLKAVEGSAGSTCGAVAVQAAGTDSEPSEAASPTPADGAPTPDEGWSGHCMSPLATIYLP